MLQHLFKIALRNFYKNKFYSAINIICLALGICFCLFTTIYISQEYAINKDLKNSDNQFVLKTKWRKQDMGPDITVISMLAKGLKDEYPHVVSNYYRYNPVTNIVSAGDRFFQEDIAIGDTTLVDMYGFKTLYGDPKKAFQNNSSAVITETLAKKLFNTSNAIGKTLSIQTTVAGKKQDFMVSAVLEDITQNSVTGIIGTGYSVFVPFTGNEYFGGGDFSTTWENLGVLGFVELQAGKTEADLQRSIDQIIRKNSPDFIWKNLTATPFRVSDYHLKDNNGALSKMIMILSMIAILVLLMVVINFINITIGRSSSRLKEIALKKTFGSGKSLILRQFLVESFVLSFVAMIISLLIYQAVKPLLSGILEVDFPSVWNLAPLQWLALAIITPGISVIAGIYPALTLSNTRLTNAVKGKLDQAKGSVSLQRVLLITQFTLAIVVFICAVNISNQVKYLFSKDLGYSRDQLLVVTALPKQWDSAGVARMETIKHEMKELPGVSAASIAFDVPDAVPFGKWEVLAPKSSSADGQITLSLANADEDYAKTIGLKMVQGNFFEHSKEGIVLNEAAVRQLGEPTESIIGTKIKTIAGGEGIPVTGVVKDFNYSSMQEKIAPMGFLHLNTSNTYRFLVIKLATADITRNLDAVRNKWKEMSPNTPFNYSFMDEKFAALYKTELQLQKASNLATVLNFAIVFLGIIGVVAFMLQKRMKEIAVRKVLGAGAVDIIYMFLKEYAGLIALSSLIAWPIAYVASERMLQQFAYRTNQAASSYLGAFTLVAVLSFVLVTLQCLRTASANPITKLKAD
ncbi:MAG: ABC transporter permease [Flavitalea sp.]